jgi:hypothetical protein
MTDAEAMIQDCLKRESKLSDWEQGFIKKLVALPSIKLLPYADYLKLELIWERIT